MENTDDVKREEVAMSTVNVSIVLMVVMALPLIILILMGAWIVAFRLLIAILVGVLAIVYAKKADKLSLNNEIDEAVKIAKKSKGYNIFGIIYGILSWIAFIRVLAEI